MNKLIIKMLVMVGLFIGISNYVLMVKTGKSMDFGGIFPKDMSVDGVLNSVKDSTPTSLSVGVKEETVYKWVDENGITHYSAEQPASIGTAEVMTVRSDTNVVQGTETSEVAPTIEKPSTDLENINLSPQRVQKLMKDAQNVENLLQEREQQQRQLIDGE